MAAQDITEDNKRPLGSVYGSNSQFNAVQQQIDTAIQGLETAFVGRIESCSSSGPSGSKTVSATPMTQMVDANGNAYKSPAYQALPHYRVQQGVAALIIDPVPGDMGVFVCSKRDISNINSGTASPVPPASARSFNGADAVMVGSIHTKTPTVYIELKQDNTILIHAPSGVTIESDSSVTIKAPQVTIEATETTVKGHMTVEGGLNVSGGSGAEVDGSLTTTGDVVADGISLDNHTHGGVQPGGGDTSGPN